MSKKNKDVVYKVYVLNPTGWKLVYKSVFRDRAYAAKRALSVMEWKVKCICYDRWESE